MKTVLYIDDRPDSRNTYSEDLSEIFGSSVKILAIAPLGTLSEMLSVVINQSQLVSLVLDQRLYESGDTDYTGLNLAALVRSSLPKLPIYILTNWTDKLDDAYHVEYVFEKEKISEDEYKKEATARVRRHINVFEDIIDEREDRFAELLPKYLGKQLSADEVAEFLKLKAVRIKPYSHEFDEDDELRAKLDQQAAVLGDILKELEKEL
ncbi:MAG: CheY-like chemotaxis protein [Bacteroidia bacterium]|jgi:CheY-like chemotaxis protein